MVHDMFINLEDCLLFERLVNNQSLVHFRIQLPLRWGSILNTISVFTFHPCREFHSKIPQTNPWKPWFPHESQKWHPPDSPSFFHRCFHRFPLFQRRDIHGHWRSAWHYRRLPGLSPTELQCRGIGNPGANRCLDFWCPRYSQAPRYSHLGSEVRVAVIKNSPVLLGLMNFRSF